MHRLFSFVLTNDVLKEEKNPGFIFKSSDLQLKMFLIFLVFRMIIFNNRS